MAEGKGAKRVVMVLTSCDKYPNGDETGVWIGEVSHPYYVFQKAGYDVKLVSLTGKSNVDPSSLSGDFYDDINKKFLDEEKVECKSLPALDSVSADDLDVLFFAGGLGTMWDFPDSKIAQDLILKVLEDGAPLVKGKVVTGFSNEEDKQIGVYEAGPKSVSEPTGPGSNEDVFNKLKKKFSKKIFGLGAKYECGEPWSVKVEEKFHKENFRVCVDGNIFTGQNPPSAGPLAEAVIKSFE